MAESALRNLIPSARDRILSQQGQMPSAPMPQETFRGRAFNTMYDMFGGNSDDPARRAQATRRAEGLVGAGRFAADFTPVVGDALAIDEAREAYRQGNMGQAAILGGLATLGMVPIGGDAASRAIRSRLDIPNQPAMPMAVEPNLLEGRVISERFPTAVSARENPMTDFLVADINALKTDPKQTQKIAETMSQYPNYQGSSSSPDEIINSMKEHSISNLEFLYNQMPPEIRQRSAQWYNGANRKANELASIYGVNNEAVAGVIASMSPQKDWYQNVGLAERVLDIYKNRADHVFDSDMVRTASAKLEGKTDHLRALERIKGMRLSDIQDPVERSIFIRMFDETYNPRSYNIYSPEGDRLGLYMTSKGEPRSIAWGSFGEIAKAVRVLDNPNIENISSQMGEQHKVRNFYNNIIAPSNPSSITADTHAVAGALLRPLGGSAPEVSHNLGSAAGSAVTGIRGTYPVFADAYREFASANQLLPRQAQSIAWEGARGLFSPEQKRNQALLGGINDIMQEFKRGNITQRGMQDAILNEAGGVSLPDWAR